MFRLIAMGMAAICAVLFVILAGFPSLYVQTYGAVASPSSDFIALRASPMFAGLAVAFWLARNAEPSVARDALCKGVAVMFIGIAFTGLYEFGRGYANALIAVAAVAEMALAAILLLAASLRS